MRLVAPCPSIVVRLIVDDREIGQRRFCATKTSQGRSRQFDCAIARLHRDYPNATRHKVSP